MGYTRLGQLVQTQQQTYRQAYRFPPVYMPYGHPAAYAAAQQRQQANVDPEEVQKAIYKDLTKEIKKEPSAAGTEPQKILKLSSGLEVPQYIVQRDVARKKNDKLAAEAAAKGPPPEIPPIFYTIGVFASEQPAMASIIAVGLGAVAGNVYFNSRKDH